ncbi:TPA: tail fiber assembly protein [Escherichia coli]
MALSNPPPTPEQLLEQAEAERSRRRVIADGEIEWRQYAVDKGIATDEESAALDEWNMYRVQLMRVDPANPVWPEMPI